VATVQDVFTFLFNDSNLMNHYNVQLGMCNLDSDRSYLCLQSLYDMCVLCMKKLTGLLTFCMFEVMSDNFLVLEVCTVTDW
jgi:hypothetical protein